MHANIRDGMDMIRGTHNNLLKQNCISSHLHIYLQLQHLRVMWTIDRRSSIYVELTEDSVVYA
ncbi:hypothetical protein F442_15380 [Phytophthora nicotianae P10297]|uniref:Uncharacterized protein n=2 Tax=Phytophthora nicotianae TaxID=4792 RepID=W2R1Q1_PHYN3|nr:hypothetical protein PPTG_21432 [Phytophthora nicotianae INRA-310]ETN19206.1 hypothetical protein PPTG_21432 [Phytophthora nicotianae INRA-310]ETP36746.1 hypothetical protein F442_15380 [Phytophthora nicotianae P10297]